MKLNNNTSDTARIILGVTGGIAAFKALNILRKLKKQGHEVIVIPTENALKMVGKTSFEALSDNKVFYDLFEHDKGYGHVQLSEWADLIIIAPATANFIAKMTSGITDDLLSATLLATKKPVVVFPAMHTNMYEHPATQNNIKVLIDRGIKIVEPEIGELTNGDVGKGRLPDEDYIIEQSLKKIKEKDLKGKKILITAGGTKEYIDPVRCITNNSSGKQGIALAVQGYDRGAEVTLVSCNISENLLPKHIKTIKVETSNELHNEVLKEYENNEIIIMCAAVSDWTVKTPSEKKIKKDKDNNELTLEFVKTVDILKEISDKNINGNKIILGFAAETGDTKTVFEYGKSKIKNKNCDLLAINPVGKNLGFGQDNNQIYIIDRQGEILLEKSDTKTNIADSILDIVSRYGKKQ